MKVENPKTVAESKSKTPENKGSKKPTEAKPKESYVSHEIEVFTSLKKGTFIDRCRLVFCIIEL